MQTPNDCALLLTLPLTREAFLSDLDQGSSKDFVKHWSKIQRLAKRVQLTDAELWNIYADRVVGFVERIADEVASAGVQVIFSARARDLVDLSRRKQVLTLVAHWVSPKLQVSDFHDFNRFAKALASSDALVAQALRAHLEFDGQIHDDGWPEPISGDPLKFVERLNGIFGSANSPSTRPSAVATHSVETKAPTEIWIHLNRYALERRFPDEIAPACKFEMSDALYTPVDLQDAISPDFDGVIDLIVCNSELAGQTLKGRRPCLVVTNRYVTDLKRLILYKGAIKLLANGDCTTYIEANLKIRKLLAKGRED